MLKLSNFIKILLWAMAMLLFTACSGKSEAETNATTESNVTVEQNTTTDTSEIVEENTTVGQDTNSSGGDGNTTVGGADDNATTKGGNDDNTTAGGDDNVTTTPTVTLTSLKLTVNKTTLNKDENTTVKVMATYSDSSTKEVTDKVEWVVIPSDAVKMANTTLTALQDRATTVKAKLNTVVSDAISLNITWTVNGHTLPPEPDKATNDSTLLGIDSNDNGVRDDVERWIYDRYKDEHPVMIPLKIQASRAYQKIIIDPSKARETTKVSEDAVNCEWAFTSLSANYFGRKPLVLIESEDSIQEDKEMEYIQYNTSQRARAYGLYNQTLSGGVYGDDGPEDSWIENCDFNTTKYIEMSEKL